MSAKYTLELKPMAYQSYPDDNTPYLSDEITKNVMPNFSKLPKTIFQQLKLKFFCSALKNFAKKLAVRSMN